MDHHSFINRVRSLFNIDAYLLPELAAEQQVEFIRDPVRYYINADKAQADAIFREVEKRQRDTAVSVETVARALRPFSAAHERSADPIGDSDLDGEQPRSVTVTLGDFRHARRVLAVIDAPARNGELHPVMAEALAPFRSKD